MIEVRHNSVPSGSFVLIYADITERKRSEAALRAARDAAKEASRTIEAAYLELKAAQANLIQAEKMASLGRLTTGITHEIKNLLNFVNNFAILSVELLGELKETLAKAEGLLDDDQRAEVEEVVGMLTGNLEKITPHAKRTDGIVKAMLEHSRGASGERRTVNIKKGLGEQRGRATVQANTCVSACRSDESRRNLVDAPLPRRRGVPIEQDLSPSRSCLPPLPFRMKRAISLEMPGWPRGDRRHELSGEPSPAKQKNFCRRYGRRCTQNTRMGLSAAWWFTAAPRHGRASPMRWPMSHLRVLRASACICGIMAQTQKVQD